MVSINYPRQVVMVTSRASVTLMGKEELKEDIATLTWHTPVSLDPKTYAVSFHKGHLSTELIRRSGIFVVNFIPFALQKEAIFCEKHSGMHIGKFKETGLTKEEASAVDCPKIGESLGYIECEVLNEVEVGDHVLFIGKVVHMEMDKFGKRLFMKDKDKFTTTID